MRWIDIYIPFLWCFSYLGIGREKCHIMVENYCGCAEINIKINQSGIDLSEKLWFWDHSAHINIDWNTHYTPSNDEKFVRKVVIHIIP